MIKSMTLCQSDQIAQIVWIIYVRIDWRLVKVDHVYRFYVNRFWFIVLKCVISRFHFDDEYFLIRSDSLDILHLNLSMNILVEE